MVSVEEWRPGPEAFQLRFVVEVAIQAKRPSDATLCFSPRPAPSNRQQLTGIQNLNKRNNYKKKTRTNLEPGAQKPKKMRQFSLYAQKDEGRVLNKGKCIQTQQN